MELNKLEELSLEYLSTQIHPIDYQLLYSRIFEENGFTYDKISVSLWLRLYSNREVLIIINEELDEYLRLNYPLKSKVNINSLYDIDVTEFADIDLENHVGSTKLICSNIFRIKKLNLALYDQVVKSNDRFRLLMAIASKRYSGYWQSDLVEDLKLTPKDLFSLLSCLCKFGLVYKLTIPQNSIYKYLIDNINENFDIKYDTKEDTQDSDKDSSIKNSASICFFHKYFVIDKLPENLKALCFSEVTRNCESTMLEVLENTQNNIMLESDWRRSYFNIAFGELNQFNIKVENHLISRSYMSLKKSLESKNKVTVIFAWCPQTNKYERSVMLLKNQKDNILRLKRTSMVHVINMKTEVNDDEDSDDEKSGYITHDMRGHSLQEYLYYLIKTAPDGISAKGIHNYVASKYKSLAKILLHMESIGLIRKETHRDAKIFMYKYYTKDSRRPLVKTEDSSDDSCRSTSTHYEIDVKVDDPMAETPVNADRPTSGLHGTKYIDFINSQKIKYYDDSVYLRDYESLFSGTSLSRAVSTVNFKKRMVMMNNYLEYFKAATHTNISKYISDIEGKGSRPDRKTIIRISDRVLKKMTHFKSIKCDEIKGSNMTLTVMYDTRHFTQTEAYNFLRNDINEKRILICSKSAQMKSKINDHFKNPEHLKNIADDPVEIINSSNSNVGNLKMPLLVKDVSVNQQNTNVSFDEGILFSQRRLSLNGYVFPIMTRVKMLHGFLIQNFKNEFFTTAQVLKAMTLENYFQLIGCGYHITNVVEHMNERIENLPQEHINILTNKRRDPINILNNQLNFLYRIKLLSFTSETESNNGNTSLHATDNNDGYYDDGNVYNKSVKKNKKNETVSKKKRKLSDINDESSKPNIKVECTKTELKWKLIRYVHLYDFVLNENKQKYDLYKDHLEYWHNFKVQVDEYISTGNTNLPEVLPVKELFSKKNWKKAIYLNTIVKSELDRVITFWMDLCCSGLHAKSQTKLCHIPYKVIRVLCDRFNLTKTQIQSQLKSKLRVHTCDSQPEDDRILNKILSNIYKGTELLWISRYVISEKIVNRIFLNILHNNPHTLPRINEINQYSKMGFSDIDGNGSSVNGVYENSNKSDHDVHEDKIDSLNSDNCDNENKSSTGNLPDVWKYLHILFKYKYSENECKVIFDYIINNSTINLRVLKKLRRLKTSEIIRYISKKSYTGIMNTYNTASTNFYGSVQVNDEESKPFDNQIEYLTNKLKLKCTMFTSSSKRLGSAVSVHQEIKYYKKILKSWNEYGWLVRCKKRSMILKVFKLSIMSKIKLFPKYTNIYFYGNQLLSYMDLNNHDNFTPIHQPYKNSGGKSDIGRNGTRENDLPPNYNKMSIITNCLEMDIHNIYNMVESFNEISFDMKWTFQAQKEDKTNYYRLIDGGISKHIKTLTTNIGVSQVKANITDLQNKLNNQEYKRGLNTLRILPKLYVCDHEATDIIDPVVFCNEPLNSSPLVNENRNNQETNKKINTISDLLMYVMKIYEVDFKLKIMEKAFYKLIKVVKSKGSHGISHSELIMIMENKKINPDTDFSTRFDDFNGYDKDSYVHDEDKISENNRIYKRRKHNSDNININKNMKNKTVNDDYTTDYNTDLYKILINTGVILRLIFMVPNGSEFIYLYWEHSQKIMINTPCFCKKVIRDSVFSGKTNDGVEEDEDIDEDDCYDNDVDNYDEENEYDADQNYNNDENDNEDDYNDYNYNDKENNDYEDDYNNEYINSHESSISVNKTGCNSDESTQNSNGVSSDNTKESTENRVRSRPDYISEILWLIFQKNTIEIHDNLEEFTMPIRDLLGDLEEYTKALGSSAYSPFTVLDGCFNIHMVAYISLKIYSIVKEKPGLTVHEVWKDMAILDECEVELLIESLITLKIILYKEIIVEVESNHIFSSNKKISSVKRVLYPQETCAALLKFKSILLVR